LAAVLRSATIGRRTWLVYLHGNGMCGKTMFR
jgi:hypothetical protein